MTGEPVTDRKAGTDIPTLVTVPLPPGVTQVLSSRRNLVPSGVPLPSRAVAIVPEPICGAAMEIASAPPEACVLACADGAKVGGTPVKLAHAQVAGLFRICALPETALQSALTCAAGMVGLPVRSL